MATEIQIKEGNSRHMPLLRPRAIRADKVAGRVMVSPTEQDSLLAAVIKWIPVEVLTVYKAVDGFIPAERYSFRLGFIISATAVCALWIAFATKPSDKRLAWRQVILAPIAFLCWAVAIETDLIQHVYKDWQAWMGSVILGGGTLLLPIFDGILKSLGVSQGE